MRCTGTLATAVLAAAISLVGCDSVPAQPTKSTANTPTSMTTSESERTALKSGLTTSGVQKPAADAGPARVAPPPHPAASTGGLRFEPPADWKSTPPKSAMRKAQFLLPRADGDTEDGEAMMFDSGSLGGGGSADINIARWRGMMTSASGGPLGDDAGKVETMDKDGFKFTFLDISGRYTPAAMGGAPEAPHDNYRMLAAVVESGEERYFIRATGPAATMAKHADPFRAYVLSAKR